MIDIKFDINKLFKNKNWCGKVLQVINASKADFYPIFLKICGFM